MRIIAGSLGGRPIESPRSHRTHPMSEKVRGALFNMLGDVGNLRILDAFGGSGAIGIEAVSRGAREVVILEIDRAAADVIKRNVDDLSVSANCKVIRANASGWSDNNPELRFDVVVCDPPYDSVQPHVLTKLAQHVSVGGMLVCSLPPNTQLTLDEDWQEVAVKDYNDATLVFYRRTG